VSSVQARAENQTIPLPDDVPAMSEIVYYPEYPLLLLRKKGTAYLNPKVTFLGSQKLSWGAKKAVLRAVPA